MRILHDVQELRDLYRKMALDYDVAKTQLARPLGITIDEALDHDRLEKQTTKMRDRFGQPVLAR